MTGYYDQPLLKESVWGIDIPLYYFTGGAAGAALALGAAVQLGGNGDLRRFSQHCHWLGIAGSTLGAAFLIHDLGRPSRFLYMVRVFRPTSPMNMGAWILGGAAPTAIATGLLINRGGVLGKIGEATGYASGLFGAALAGYTGVLVSNSAIPVWQESRRWMPVLFLSSAMASAASILDLFYEEERANRITYTFGNVGRVVELAASYKVEESFERPEKSVLWKAASALTAASLIVSAIPGRSRKRRKIAGVLGVLGSLALRFAVHHISKASARGRSAAELQPGAAASESREVRTGAAARGEIGEAQPSAARQRESQAAEIRV